MTAGSRGDMMRLVEAAIAAVNPESLVRERLACGGRGLLLDGREFADPVGLDGSVAIVGGGKAAAGLAAGVEAVLAACPGPAADVGGLVAVPGGCGRRLRFVEVREARPAAANLPTAATVAATREMVARLATLARRDLAIVLVTGGGSALVEDPVPGVGLADLVAVTGSLAAAGAGIGELNTVRRALSAAKAGGLARSCRAGRMLVLVLSDVVGDPLDLIASGPCMPSPPDRSAAREILQRYGGTAAAPSVARHLAIRGDDAMPPPGDAAEPGTWTTPAGCRVSHVLLGTNATAVDAAARAARSLGYEVTVRHAVPGREQAVAAGRRLAAEAAGLAGLAALDGRWRATIEGGEAVVTLPPGHGLGGRNQLTVLAAAAAGFEEGGSWPAGVTLASVGTDGEDGPTESAGGFVDGAVADVLRRPAVHLADAVSRCDASGPLAAAGGLIRTGPTGTNVADVRIILARPPVPRA